MISIHIMPTRHIERIDLNLLTALDALLAERHVSRAAARLGITQPATSRALARLRAALGDPLLVRTGRGMRPTPRALALAAPLHRLLGELDDVVAAAPTFEPARAQRRFRIATADYGAAVLVPPLLAHLRRAAPGVALAVTEASGDVAAQLEAGELDFALMPRRAGPAGLIWKTLFTERFVCLTRAGLVPRLTLDRFCALGHVVVTPRGRPGNPVDDALARRGRTRTIALTVPSFLAAPLAVVDTDCVTTTPARIAARLAAPLGLAIHAPPIALGGLTIALGWHEAMRADPGHAWLRALIVRTGP
jgi:DNA-binding transcriptional LysR family regulator